jgi:Mitochondrial K+-H+ exchange-related
MANSFAVTDALTGDLPGRNLKIYLLLIDHSRFFFYSDESEASQDPDVGDDSSSSPSGVRGWFHVRYKRFRSAWQHADSGALHWMRMAWDWLHTWVHPDEAMLARLWSAQRIELLHPAARHGDEVRTIWTDYLRTQSWRHLVWLTCNGIIAPVAIVTLWILPGPNLIGYWFAYRAIHHSLVVWGIRKVQRKQVPTELYPIAALDLPIEPVEGGRMSHVALTGRAAGLDEHVAWHDHSRAKRIQNAQAVAPKPATARPANPQSENSRDR